jgi:sugar phosphate isomerase/epimerase
MLGAAWNPTAAGRAGADPEAGLSALVDAGVPIHYLVVEDTERVDGRESDAVHDNTSVDWDTQIARLVSMDFDGPLVLEVRGRPAGPAGLRASSELLRALRAARR